ncbi:hypothetical protein ACIQM4_13255 [Streptomyces sp. NPDC091272]|uniref:hypothetical protein n=1 Tax=Streptomyces sp. NPDC091272 TaxID=3365981 RepID=UPI0038249E40
MRTAAGAPARPTVEQGAPHRLVPYRHVLHQHRAALRTALVLVGVAAASAAGSLLWSAPGRADRGWGFAFAEAVRLALPLLGGALVAGPMVADELASGTYKTAWTQSVTPARWLLAKTAVAAGVLLALLVPLSVLLWRVRVAGAGADEPVVAVSSLAHALFTVASGALAGLLVRRAVPAMGLTLVVAVCALLGGGVWPSSTWHDQLYRTLFLLAGAAVAAGVAFLLLRRVPQGVGS